MFLKLIAQFRFLLLILMACALGCAANRTNVIPDSGMGNSSKDTVEIYSAVMQAHYLSFNGAVDEALELFSDTVQRFPDSSELQYQYGKFLLDLAYRVQDRQLAEDYLRLAQTSLRKSIEIEDDVDIRKMLAEVSIELFDYQDAIDQLSLAIKSDPDDDDIKLALARLYIHVDRSQDAIELLRPAVENKNLTNYEFLKVFALAYGESNRLMEAINYYELYLEQIPMEYEAAFNLGLCYFRSSQLDEAEEILTKMSKNNMLTSEVADLLIDVYKSQKRYMEAIGVLKQIALNPRFDIEANIEIGQLYLRLNNLDSAYEHLLKVISKDPNNRAATFYTALVLSEMDRLPDALRMLENNLEDTPVSMASVDLASGILMKLGKYKLAVELCGKLLQEEKIDPRSYLIYANALEVAGDSDAALKVLTKGRKDFPDYDRIGIILGYKLDRIGKWKEALAIFEELLVKMPDNPEFANFVGYSLAVHNQNLEKAHKLLEMAIEAEPDNPAYQDSLGWVYFRMGNFAKASYWLLKAVEQMPDDVIVLDHVIRTLIETGKFSRAKEFLSRAFEISPDDKDLLECRELLDSKVVD